MIGLLKWLIGFAFTAGILDINCKGKKITFKWLFEVVSLFFSWPMMLGEHFSDDK